MSPDESVCPFVVLKVRMQLEWSLPGFQCSKKVVFGFLLTNKGKWFNICVGGNEGNGDVPWSFPSWWPWTLLHSHCLDSPAALWLEQHSESDCARLLLPSSSHRPAKSMFDMWVEHYALMCSEHRIGASFMQYDAQTLTHSMSRFRKDTVRKTLFKESSITIKVAWTSPHIALIQSLGQSMPKTLGASLQGARTISSAQVIECGFAVTELAEKHPPTAMNNGEHSLSLGAL